MESVLNHSSIRKVGLKKQSDRGAAMVMAAIISVVVMTLAGVTLSFANRENTASNGDRQRQHAIDAAMAASVVANSALANNAAYAGSGLVSFGAGANAAQYEVTVATDTTVTSGFRRVITSYGYAPSKAAAVSVGDLDAIVSSSTGANQTITGTLRANGSVSVSNTSTIVYGSVYAGGSISTGGTIRDTAQAGGTVSNCAKVQGSCIQHSAPPVVPVQQLPPFTFDPANYSPAPLYPTGSAFQTGVKNGTYTQGVYKISGSVSFANNDTLRLTGDMTIFTTGSLNLPGTIVGPTGQNVQLTVVVGGSAVAPNNLTIPSTVKTLIYTNGSFAASNKLIFTGALYAHGSFAMGANSSITYAPVSAPGFDWTNSNPRSFTIRNISTRETTGS